MSMQVIEHIEVGSGGAASIEFTSISGSFTDLYVLYSLRTDRNPGEADYLLFSFNGVTTNLSSRYLEGNSTAANSYTSATEIIGVTSGDQATASTFGNGSLYIPNYAGSTNKSVSIDAISEDNGSAAGDAVQHITAGLWSDTSAITAIKISPYTGSNFLQYSSATLYGITAGSDGTTTVS